MITKTRVTIGPFVGWKPGGLPKCVRPKDNKGYSIRGLGRKQRDYVLRCYGYQSYQEYLESDLWKSIRLEVVESQQCVANCGRLAVQVHHRFYSEANLLGQNRKGLTPMCRECHYEIEFNDEKKNCLSEANRKLLDKRYPERKAGNLWQLSTDVKGITVDQDGTIFQDEQELERQLSSVIITTEIIEAGRGSNGGWSVKQLRVLGKRFMRGWKKGVVGTTVMQYQVDQFLALKDAQLEPRGGRAKGNGTQTRNGRLRRASKERKRRKGR